MLNLELRNRDYIILTFLCDFKDVKSNFKMLNV